VCRPAIGHGSSVGVIGTGVELSPDATGVDPSHRRTTARPWTPSTPPEPPSLGDDPSIAALLDEAEDIVNAAVPRVRAEVDADEQRRARREARSWKRFFRRK
jgi:hypothetical protein